MTVTEAFWSTVVTPARIVLAVEAPDTADSLSLIDELTAELATAGYRAASTHGYSADQLVAAGVTFVVARDRARPLSG